MTVYPNNIDSDIELPRIEDNITEIGGITINALIEAVVALESVLGTNIAGSAGTLKDRLDVLINADGTPNITTLSAVGLITLPITDSQIAAGAGIVESKLSLDHSTATLSASISSNSSDISALQTSYLGIENLIIDHLFGKSTIIYNNRHVASHIDINTTLDGDPGGRDDGNYYSTLNTVLGSTRPATNVMSALIEINNDLISHVNNLDFFHTAQSITVDTSQFLVIPPSANTVQAALQYIDTIDSTIAFDTNSRLSSTGIPRKGNVYRVGNDANNIVYGTFACTASELVNGDNIVTFTVASGELDWAFRQVVPGDYVVVNYGGYEISHVIINIAYTPSSSYVLTIDGVHPVLNSGLNATIKKSTFEENSYGVLAVVPVNHSYFTGPLISAAPGSAIALPPNCPHVIGADLCLDEIDSSHYNLYLAFYPTGNPAEANYKFPILEAIDVTENKGKTPGKYTLRGIIENVNRHFRKGGTNLRFAAFEYKGQFGLAIADTAGYSSFSIISGTASGSTMSTGLFINNIIDYAGAATQKDALGLGSLKANVASPVYSGPSSTTLPTKVIAGRVNRKTLINGVLDDLPAKASFTNADGYVAATLVQVQNAADRYIGIYQVSGDIERTKLSAGSSIVVYPSINRSDPRYNENDYGRFIVDNAVFDCNTATTSITVINCRSITGNAKNSGVMPGDQPLPVRIYFDDSVISFPKILASGSTNYCRVFEIFANRNSNIFVGERGRFDITSGDTELGKDKSNHAYNDGWNIKSISPKLFGLAKYGDITTSKFIRLAISSYNAIDGSFVAHLCQSSTGPETDRYPGQAVLTRKNETFRVYDYNGSDYIDFIFSDSIDTAYTISNGYIDIELFDSLRTNNEYLPLACCTQLCSSNSSIWNITDLRQFGTVSEKILSTSAIDFIEAADRILHGNGVYSDFGVRSLVVNSLSINGGVAIVNGKVINKNSFVVYGPKLYDALSDPTTLTYAVCIKDDGTTCLVLIGSTITTANYRSTALEADRTYTITTVAEIIEKRKDLLPIYVIEVACGSAITPSITNYYDIRKFISNKDSLNGITISGSFGLNTASQSTKIGSFYSLEAAKNYIKYAGGIDSVLHIKGIINVTTAVDFTDVPVHIIGEKGCQIIYSSDVAIYASSNFRIDGVKFVRQSVADASFNFVQDKGTIYFNLPDAFPSHNVVSDIIIENCIFDTYSDTYRCAGCGHIVFCQNGDNTFVKGVTIRGNTFLEAKTQLCIAFVNKNGQIFGTSGAFGTILSSVDIVENIGNFGSYILISHDDQSYGLSSYGLNVSNNKVDYILYNLKASLRTEDYPTEFKSLPSLISGAVFSKNTCIAIVSKSISGSIASASTDVPSSDIIISNNICSTIFCFLSTSATVSSELCISNNIMKAHKYDFYNFPEDQSYTALSNLRYAIYVEAPSSANKSTVIISNNSIYSDSLTKLYAEVVYCSFCNKVNITGNIIDGFSSKGILVYENYIATVTNNSLFRRSEDVSSYIWHYSTASHYGIITDNYFDNIYTTGTTEGHVSSTEQYCTIERNKNQSFTVDLMPFTNPVKTGYSGNEYIGVNNDNMYQIYSTFYDGSYSYPAIVVYPGSGMSNPRCSGFIINLPNLNGAILEEITMDAVLTDKASTGEYFLMIGFAGIKASDPTMSLDMMSGNNVYKLPEYNTSSYVRGDTVRSLTMPISDFQTRFGPIISTSRYIQMYIAPAIRTSYYQPELSTSLTDYFMVKSIIGKFRY